MGEKENRYFNSLVRVQAKELRREPTHAETILWEAQRNRGLQAEIQAPAPDRARTSPISIVPDTALWSN
jgi:hypothetical protein